MTGFQVTFLTQQNRKHGGMPLGEWLVDAARRLGIGGATLVAAAEGFGHHRRIHAARFIELADQPIEVMMAISAEECTRLFEHLRREQVNVFYIKAPIEYGMSAEA